MSRLVRHNAWLTFVVIFQNLFDCVGNQIEYRIWNFLILYLSEAHEIYTRVTMFDTPIPDIIYHIIKW